MIAVQLETPTLGIRIVHSVVREMRGRREVFLVVEAMFCIVQAAPRPVLLHSLHSTISPFVPLLPFPCERPKSPLTVLLRLMTLASSSDDVCSVPVTKSRP
jgi:hypothetical protein